MIAQEQEIFSHVLRDMSDGVLVLDDRGTVLHLNERGRALLGEERELTGEKYAALFAENAQGANDAFHQFVLDAVYDKVHTHSGEIDYRMPGGEKRRFRMTSSFLRGEDRQTQTGVVVLFDDVTELARLQRQRRESSIVFAVLMICVCVYLFLWSLLRIFDGKHAAALSIIVSSLVFGVLHITCGLPFMLGASLLLGVLYHKQGNIWGLSIIHYVLGEAATFLRYLI